MDIIPVGGFKEIGRNCVIVKSGDDAVMLDMGVLLDNYIKYSERDDLEDGAIDFSPESLMEVDAVPYMHAISDVKKYVKAICISHAHLDHAGAVPFMGKLFNCPVHGSPFTIEVIRTIIKDERIKFKNELVAHKSNSRFKVGDRIEVEFIHVTHSTPQTVSIAVHTPEGTVLYVNDFKFDNAPVLGPKPNYERFGEIKPKVLIMDSLYSLSFRKTPSESIAREMLKDVMLGTHTEGKSVIVTTFSSQIARLQTIVELGRKMDRKIVFLGRSLSRYVEAAERCGLADFAKDVERVKYGAKVKNYLAKVSKPEKCLFVATGHQGEPKATLWKMVNGAFRFNDGDEVIFSCNIIPTQENIDNREHLEEELRRKHVRIFRDIHVSGHASREDHRDLITIVKPEHIIPTHGSLQMLVGLRELATEMGYAKEKVHIIGNGDRLKV